MTEYPHICITDPHSTIFELFDPTRIWLFQYLHGICHWKIEIYTMYSHIYLQFDNFWAYSTWPAFDQMIFALNRTSGRPITFFSYRPIPIMTDNCNFLIGRYRLIIPISADTDTDYWYIYVIEQRQFLDNNFHMNIELMIYWDFAINSKSMFGFI